MKTTLESAHYQEFQRRWDKGDFPFLRFGQAFHQWFNLQKSTQYQNSYDHLYQLDGDAAKTEIQKLFDFN